MTYDHERRNPVLRMVRDVRGTAPRIAQACGINREAVWNWQRVPAEHVLTVEQLLDIPRHRIRPDLYPPPSDPLTKRWLNNSNGRRQPYDHWKTTDPTDAQYCRCGRWGGDCICQAETTMDEIKQLEAQNRELRAKLGAMACELATARGQLEYVLAMLRDIYEGVRREQEQQTRRTPHEKTAPAKLQVLW